MQKESLKFLTMKNIGDHQNLYVHIDALFLADVFENFRNKCIEIYKLDSA